MEGNRPRIRRRIDHFIESFDHYATADITTKWTSNQNGVISSRNGRRGTSSLRWTTGAPNNCAAKILDAQSTWTLGFSFKASNIASGIIGCSRLQDGATVQCDLRVNADGTLAVTRNGTTLGTTSFALSSGVTYYIEWKILIHASSGGEGSNRQFSCSTGSTHNTLVNETAPNGDTNYVEDSVAGHYDTWAVADVTVLASPSIFGVQATLSAKKSDAGSRGLGVVCKNSSTTSDGPDTALSTTYAYLLRILETDPATSAAWTENGVNAAEFGVKVTS
jgi:hypothetical protein